MGDGHTLWIAALCALGSSAAVAGGPMTAAEFEAYTTGRTLTYSALGQDFGIEEYLENRRVRWSFLDGDCEDGIWYPAGEMICFVYETFPDPQFWTFYDEGGGLRALFMNDPEATELYETRMSDEPLLCLGPEVGV